MCLLLAGLLIFRQASLRNATLWYLPPAVVSVLLRSRKRALKLRDFLVFGLQSLVDCYRCQHQSSFQDQNYFVNSISLDVDAWLFASTISN